MKTLGFFESWFVHWHTSLAGVAVGVLIQVQQGTSWKTALLSGAVVMLGLVAKDGQRSNTPDPHQ